MGAGRPTDFKEEYHELLLDMARDGDSWATFCAEVGISRQTFYNWQKEIPEFIDTVQRALQLRQSFWEKKFKSKALGDRSTKTASETAMQFILRTQFRDDYAEKKEVEQTGNISITIDKDDSLL